MAPLKKKKERSDSNASRKDKSESKKERSESNASASKKERSESNASKSEEKAKSALKPPSNDGSFTTLIASTQKGTNRESNARKYSKIRQLSKSSSTSKLEKSNSISKQNVGVQNGNIEVKQNALAQTDYNMISNSQQTDIKQTPTSHAIKESSGCPRIYLLQPNCKRGPSNRLERRSSCRPSRYFKRSIGRSTTSGCNNVTILEKVSVNPKDSCYQKLCQPLVSIQDKTGCRSFGNFRQNHRYEKRTAALVQTDCNCDFTSAYCNTEPPTASAPSHPNWPGNYPSKIVGMRQVVPTGMGQPPMMSYMRMRPQMSQVQVGLLGGRGPAYPYPLGMARLGKEPMMIRRQGQDQDQDDELGDDKTSRSRKDVRYKDDTYAKMALGPPRRQL